MYTFVSVKRRYFQRSLKILKIIAPRFHQSEDGELKIDREPIIISDNNCPARQASSLKTFFSVLIPKTLNDNWVIVSEKSLMPYFSQIRWNNGQSISSPRSLSYIAQSHRWRKVIPSVKKCPWACLVRNKALNKSGGASNTESPKYTGLQLCKHFCKRRSKSFARRLPRIAVQNWWFSTTHPLYLICECL